MGDGAVGCRDGHCGGGGGAVVETLHGRGVGGGRKGLLRSPARRSESDSVRCSRPSYHLQLQGQYDTHKYGTVNEEQDEIRRIVPLCYRFSITGTARRKQERDVCCMRTRAMQDLQGLP